MKRVPIFCALLSLAQCANILFVTSFPSHSHQVMFQPVWKELSLRGHNVVAITPNPLRDESLTNLTEVDISKVYEKIQEARKDEDTKQWRYYLTQKPGFFTVFIKDIIMTMIFNQMHETILNLPNMQEFLKQDHKFDVVIVEWLYPTFAAFGAKYKAPMIGITSLGAPIPALDTVGNPSHPVYAPDHNLPVGRDMTFRERLLSALWAFYVRITYHTIILPREDALARKYMGEDLPYLGDTERNVSLLLLNRNPVFHKTMPVVPAIVELGYLKKNKSESSLNVEIKKFLDQSKNGVVYFSLGSNIMPSILPQEVIKEIVETFRIIPYDVIFKWDQDTLENKPKNVLLTKWVPQEAVLRHKNTKLFVTQGGLQSSDEAIINQVPIIGIPFFSDQTSNVDTMVKYGMGKVLDYSDLTVEKFSAYIKEVITDPSYKENAKKLSQLYTDQPTDALEKAVWWIEYVIRHKGASHLRSSVMDIPWYQYLMLDIFAFISIILIVIIIILKLIIKLFFVVFRKIFYCKKYVFKNKKE